MEKNKIKLPSNRSFGIVFFIFFIIVATYPLLNDNPIRSWSLIIGFFFLILGLINSKILTPLNIIWMKLGMYLGIIISPIVMGIVFFLVVTPIFLIMKILKKDVLNLSINKEKSYWIKKDKIKSSMKNQF